MSATLYVGGLPPQATSADLEKLFSSCGTVICAWIVDLEEANAASSYGLITMGSEEEAVRALLAMTDFEQDGHQLTVVHLKDESIGTIGALPKAGKDGRAGRARERDSRLDG